MRVMLETLAAVRLGPVVWLLAAVLPFVWGLLVCWALERLWPAGGRAKKDGSERERPETTGKSRPGTDGGRDREFLDFQI